MKRVFFCLSLPPAATGCQSRKELLLNQKKEKELQIIYEKENRFKKAFEKADSAFWKDFNNHRIIIIK